MAPTDLPTAPTGGSSASAPGPLGRLALARGDVDRRAERRTEPDLLDRLRDDPATRVLSLVGASAEVHGDGGATRLRLRPPAEVGDAAGRLWVYLGQDPAGTEHLAAADPVAEAGAEADSHPDPGTKAAVRLAGLREVGSLLDDTGAGLLTTAAALANWHATHTHCSRCGAPTVPHQSGWVRRCPVDASEHYPRTDPAIIATVTDADDRVLLGHSPAWPEGRFSTLAGFVEPGESLEDSVRREVGEESGVLVGEVSYLGSQPWPFPASLMVGCTAVALDPTIVVDGVEVTEARWFSREDLLRESLAGRVLLPSGISIARHLVEHWFGGPLPAQGTWR